MVVNEDGTITFANAGELSEWLRRWQDKAYAAGFDDGYDACQDQA